MNVTSWQSWPRGLNLGSVVNGMIPRADLLDKLEVALAHLCGFGVSLGGWGDIGQAGGTFAPTNTGVWSLQLKPYARDIEVWVLAEGTTAVAQQLTISTSVAGSVPLVLDWQGGTAVPDQQYTEWRGGNIYSVGSGKAVSGANIDVTITNSSAGGTCIIWGFAARQLHNVSLAPVG